MMARPVKIGLVGCGFFGQFQMNAWAEMARNDHTPIVELVAICDQDRARAEALAPPGVRVFGELSEMLATETLDLVDVATRMDTHLAMAEATLRAGHGCILQKPLAPTWSDCLAIRDLACGHFVAVHENFRYQAPFRRLREVVQSRVIGQPTWGRISLRTGFDVYANQPYFLTEERLVILDLGIHLLDLARVLFGEVADIGALTQRRNPQVRAEDSATMTLRHHSGAVSVVDCTYENRRSDAVTLSIEVEGFTGGVTLQEDGVLLIAEGGLQRVEKVPTPPFDWAESPLEVVQDSVRAACRAIANAYAAGRPAETNLEDNLRTYALAEAAYTAAQSSTRVRPETPV